MRNYLLSFIFILIVAFTAACGGASAPPEPANTPTPSGDAAAGEQLFLSSCSSCHGADARGLPGVGKNLVESEFTQSLGEGELVEFIKIGRPSGDPQNTTGIDMPPKGGNPALSDDQILDIVAYLRDIHQ